MLGLLKPALQGSERTDSRSGSECSGEPEGVGTNGNLGWRTFDSSLGAERGFDSSLGLGAGAALASPPPAIEIAATGGAWARAPVAAGTRFGPFLGKWVLEPQREEHAWEVLVPSAGIRGFLDASDFPTWLKFVRRSSRSNLRHVLLGGQIFYQTIRDIRPDEELLLGERQPIQLDGGEEAADKAEEEEEEEEEERKQQVRENSLEEDDVLDEEDNTVKCLVCDKAFPDVYILDKHMVDSHRYEAEKYVCEHCNKGFAWRPNLLRHKMIHGEFRRFPCENCDKVFTDPSNLQRHIRTSHVGARCHACPECGKTFATSSGLKQHTHIHSSVKPFRCEVCFKSYTQFSNLCRHKRMHANCRMQIKCHKCGQAFSTVTSLSKHRRFCDSTPAPFLGQSPKLGGLDLGGGEHPPPPHPAFPGHLQPKFPGSPFLQPPFSHHIQSLFGGSGTPGGAPFPFPGMPPHLMFPTMLQRMAMSQLNNGKGLLSPPAQHSPEAKDAKLEAKLEEEKHQEEVKANIAGFRSMQEFHQKLMNGVNNGEKRREAAEEEAALGMKQEPEPVEEEPLESFDVNRNKSETERREGSSPRVEKETALDLSTPRKSPASETMASSGEESSPCSPPQVDQHQPQQLEPASPPRTESPIASKEEEKEPRGFQPVNAASKSFIPVTENISLFPKTSPTVSTSSPFARPPFSAGTTDPSLPFPRPVNPFLLGAMYRMNQQQAPTPYPNPFPHSLPHIAPRPPMPFSSPFLSPLPSSPFIPSSLPLLGRLGCYQDVLSSHSKSKDRYACKYCGKVFPRSANLTRHLRTHTGEQPYKCKYCERSFSISSNLQRHVRNIHNKEKPFKCPLCDRCFGQQTNLDRHLKKHETCSDPMDIVDSPESVRNDDDMGYFDEIRSFMGKVVDKNCSMDASENEVDVEEDDDIITDMD